MQIPQAPKKVQQSLLHNKDETTALIIVIAIVGSGKFCRKSDVLRQCNQVTRSSGFLQSIRFGPSSFLETLCQSPARRAFKCIYNMFA